MADTFLFFTLFLTTGDDAGFVCSQHACIFLQSVFLPICVL